MPSSNEKSAPIVQDNTVKYKPIRQILPLTCNAHTELTMWDSRNTTVMLHHSEIYIWLCYYCHKLWKTHTYNVQFFDTTLATAIHSEASFVSQKLWKTDQRAGERKDKRSLPCIYKCTMYVLMWCWIWQTIIMTYISTQGFIPVTGKGPMTWIALIKLSSAALHAIHSDLKLLE